MSWLTGNGLDNSNFDIWDIFILGDFFNKKFDENKNENNIKYIIFSLLLLVASIFMIVDVFSLNDVYYESRDYTGLVEISQKFLTIIIFAISIVCIIKSFNQKNEGVDFSFNKVMSFIFLTYSLIAILSFVFIRAYEENEALKTKDISDVIMENRSNNEELSNQFDDIVNDEYREIKSSIKQQEKKSSTIVRYLSLLTGNFGFSYEIWDYYGTYTMTFIIGCISAIFYYINSIRKDTKEDIFYDNQNYES